MSIVDTIQDQLSGDALKSLSVAAGVPEAKTAAVIGAAVPAVLSSLANSVLNRESLDGLLGALRGLAGAEAVVISRPAERDEPAEPPGDGILATLLGPNLAILTEVLAKFAGVGTPAVERLLRDLGPMILRAIAARLEGGGGVTSANLTRFFAAEKLDITRSLPAGLSLADLPSIPGIPTEVPAPDIPDSGLPGWLIPSLVLGFLALATFYFAKMPPEDPASRTSADPRLAAPGPGVIPPAPSGEGPAIPSKDRAR